MPKPGTRFVAKMEWEVFPFFGRRTVTPEHGSWLNIAECELSVLQRQALKRHKADIAEVHTQVTAWETQRNHRQVGVDWQFTCSDARIKLKRLYPIVKVL